VAIALGSAAGLACIFYLFVLVQFARDSYQEALKRRSHSAITSIF
jgi:hypothetical protein